MQSSKFVRTKLAAAAAMLLLVAGVAWADPPSQAIRLAYIAGPVSFLPCRRNRLGPSSDQSPAVDRRSAVDRSRLRAQSCRSAAPLLLRARNERVDPELRRSAHADRGHARHGLRLRALACGGTTRSRSTRLTSRSSCAVPGRTESTSAPTATRPRSPSIAARRSVRQERGVCSSRGRALPLLRCGPDRLRGGAVARPRTVRQLGRGTRALSRALDERTLRLAGHHRLRRPRCAWNLAHGGELRPRVGPVARGCGMGAVSLRPLGVGRPVGMDMDRRCSVGLRTLPLRALGACR